MDVAELCDRQEIVDLITKYTRAIDTSQWDNLYDVFTEDALLDYRPSGGPICPLSEAIPFIRNLEGFAAWQHTIGQVAITFDDDERSAAKATAYMINPLIATGPDGKPVMMEVGGYYHHEVVRTPGGWRSRHMVDELIWTR
ncbi:MAG TPA: nuclear transport factor 2 family protein [Marmoricola sp.]|nr:nuclear transport factor 2 family protein [Marmoricola sp.]